MTTATLPARDADKLLKLASLFSSDYDGEVLNAARACQGLLRRNNLTWRDILAPALPAPNGPANKSTSLDAWEKVKFCLRYSLIFREKDRDFLESILHRSRHSPKQTKWLDDLYERAMIFSCETENE